LTRDETITNILVKALTDFPSPDFALCVHLLPPHLLLQPTSANIAAHLEFGNNSNNSNGNNNTDSNGNNANNGTSNGGGAGGNNKDNGTGTNNNNANNPRPSAAAAAVGNGPDAALAEAVQKLFILNTHLGSAAYAHFWAALDGDDLYADLVADVSGFEELIRVRIAGCVGQAMRACERGVLERWLNLRGRDFDRFVGDVCGWSIGPATAAAAGASGDGGSGSASGATMVYIPPNKENEAKATVIRENVKFERKYLLHSFFSNCF
jgi:hypothetical protein